jgi:hypothetical protein
VLLGVRCWCFDVEIVVNRPELQVMLMDVTAGGNVYASEPNHLAIPKHRISGSDVRNSNFVAGLDRFRGAQIAVANLDSLTRRENHPCDRYIVLAVE